MNMQAATHRTFSALSIPNYRRYFAGQAISLIGTWMQTTAQAWLVLVLTGSATDLGIVVALQTLPTLLLGPYGGLIADRMDKRKLMVGLQALMGVQALILGVLTLTHRVTFVDVCVLAVVLGLNNCFENPARQAFVLEMVGSDNLRNAVSLNSTLVNAARAIGPAIAGVLIATVGEGWCFMLNALSFVAVVFSLMSMDLLGAPSEHPDAAQQGPAARRLPLRGADARARDPASDDGPRRDARLRVPGDAAVRGEARVPRHLADVRPDDGGDGHRRGRRRSHHGRLRTRPACGRWSCPAFGFGVVICLAAIAPTLPLELVALGAVGFASVTFLAMGNSTLQLATDPQMRGRVMALWAVAFLGSTPIGGPVIGWVTALSGARVGLGVGALSCFVAAGLGLFAVRYLGRRTPGPSPRRLETSSRAA